MFSRGVLIFFILLAYVELIQFNTSTIYFLTIRIIFYFIYSYL